MIRHSMRIFWIVLGSLMLALGAIGIVLPLLPTTPFILVSAYAFARSSPRLHAWLVQHRVFGPLIENWRKYGAISRRAKIAGLISLMAVFGLSLALGAPAHALIIQAIILPVSGIFIWSRPLPPENQG